ncbi:hypothetical protein KAR91_55660 [Candidatus Pacearchaeota archaeon]|nr:hypothetical protein [Candidatus Pacearchaeota archaeon]
MQILSFSGDGFGHLDLFSHEMKEGNIFCGDHGAGKTEALMLVMSVLSGEEYKSIDDPITQGKKRHENIVELKVDPGDEITLMDHIFRCDVGDNITVSLVKTRSGSPQLTLFNSTTGDQFKGSTTETRKIVDKFLGRFPDPKRLDDLATGTRGQREEFVKIVAEMSKTKEGELIDFTPFVVREEEARENHSTQKAHLKVLKDDKASMPVPQDDWAKVGIDQKAVSDGIQLFNEHKNKNTKRSQSIQEAERQLTEQNSKLSDFERQDEELKRSINSLSDTLKGEKNSIIGLQKSISEYQANNPIVKPEDTEEIIKQIEALQKKLRTANELKEKNQKIEKMVTDQQNKATNRTQLADQSGESISEKQRTKDSVLHDIEIIREKIIPNINDHIESTKASNQPLPWKGEVDPEGLLEVLPYLNSQMSKAVTANRQIEDREKFEEQDRKIKSTEKQMKEATDTISQVKEDERMVIEASVFPHPGIQIRRGDDNKVSVWIKDSHDNWITYNDGNHAHRMFYSVNIVTHGVNGDLKLLVIREGYALFEYMQKQIIEVANRKGFKVMMETLTSTDENAIFLGESEKPQEIVSAPLPEGETAQSMPAFGPTQ